MGRSAFGFPHMRALMGDMDRDEANRGADLSLWNALSQEGIRS